MNMKIYIISIILLFGQSGIFVQNASTIDMPDYTANSITIDGIISSGEYSYSFTKKEFTLYYTIIRDTFYFALTTNAEGWISFGFGGSGGMDNYDIITGGFDESLNSSYIFDCFSIGKVVPPPDGVQNIIEYAATQISGVTTLEGSRKINTGDLTGDHELIPGNPTNIIFAKHSTSDDISIIHTKEEKLRGVFFVGPPSAPRNLQANIQRDSVQLTWDSPLGDGGSAISNYAVYRSENNGLTYSLIATTTSTSYTDTNVVTGTIYYYTVTATNANGESGSSNNLIALPLGQITEPVGVGAVAESFKVTISWSPPIDDGGISVLNYTIYRNESGMFIPIGKTNGTTLHFIDTDVINGFQYQYRVTASNLYNESAPSPSVSAIPKGEPLPPANLSIVSGDNLATITWDPPISDGGYPLIGYSIYRSDVSGNNYSLIAANISTMEYIDTSVINGKTYYYQITAVNSFGESSPSLEQRVLIANTPLPPSVQAIGNDSSVILSWSGADGRGFPIIGYRIYKSTDLSSFLLLTETNGTTFIDTDVQNGETYYYYVSALNEVGESPYSHIVTVIPATVPSAPSNLSQRIVDDQIIISWEKPNDTGGLPITAYKIQRKEGAQPFADYDMVYSTLFIDSNVSFGITYTYRVAAMNSRGISAYSEQVTANLLQIPTAPYRLAALFENSSINLYWFYDSNETVTFNIYRTRVQGTPYVFIGSSNTTSFVDPNIELGVHYYYVVTAVNSVGESEYSDEALVSTFTVPSIPTDISVIVAPDSLTLLWLPGPGFVLPADYYLVYKSTNGISFSLFGNTTDLFFIDRDVELNKTYYYFIVAVNEFGTSDPSETVSGTIPESLPEVEVPSTDDGNPLYKQDLNISQILTTSYIFLGGLSIMAILFIVRKKIGL